MLIGISLKKAFTFLLRKVRKYCYFLELISQEKYERNIGVDRSPFLSACKHVAVLIRIASKRQWAL